jgi:periplasmic protein TonB
MSNPVIFKDLPATFPEEDKHKRPAAVGSIVIHIVMLTVVLLVPLLIPQHIEHWRLLTMIAPALPPPAPLLLRSSNKGAEPIAPAIQRVIKVEPGALVTPTEIPKEIARIIEEPAQDDADGVTGGIVGGSISGVLRSVLATSLPPVEVAPPPPPPPPPPIPVVAALSPVRIGGAVREPRVIKLVPPIYPKLAAKARVTGTVVLEATLTADGTVDEIRVISGHPLLIQAAIDSVRQWLYEPTYLNGQPVPVVLTASVNFEARITS